MKDATGREVKNGDLIFVAAGAGQGIQHGFAVVKNAETAQIIHVNIKHDVVYDEPAGDKEWLNRDGNYRKRHSANPRYDYVSRWGYTDPKPSNLRLKFSRAIVINKDEVEEPLLKTFIQEKLNA